MPTKELAHEVLPRPRAVAPPRVDHAPAPSVAKLPPANGLPSMARAGNLVGTSVTGPDPVARAKMSVALQRNLGNTGMAALVTPPPRPAVPVKSTPAAAPPPPAAAQAPAAPTVTARAPIATTAPPAATPAVPAAVPAPAAAAAPPSAKPPAHADKKAATHKTAAHGAVPESEPAGGEAPGAGVVHKPGAHPGHKHIHQAHHGAAAQPGAEEAAAGSAKKAAGGRGVVLKMKEPPADMSPASHQRLAAAQSAGGHAASAAASLPSADSHVDQARAAVTPPSAEADAKAAADLVTALGQRPKPSPEVEELCKQIYAILTSKTPDDEESLVKTDPEQMAKDAGNQLKGNVQGDVQKVDQSYAPLGQKPAGDPAQPGQAIAPADPAAATPPIDADKAAPDAIPPEDASLDADAADTKSQAAAAGMDTDAAKLGKSGPAADARDAQGDLEQTAKEDPAKVIAQQQATLAKASGDMSALQRSAVEALSSSRKTTTSQTGSQQHQMVGSEESMRTQASTQAQQIFTDAQNKVSALLQPLSQTAMQKWDARVAISSRTFKAALKEVEDWLKERHSGVGGTIVGWWDDVAGLPDWVTARYNAAEQAFGNEICDLAREISTDVNGVIMACEALIADARSRINAIFAALPANLQTWAAGEQTKFGQQLDGLTKRAHDVQTNFTRDLVKTASQSFQDARDQLHVLREKAKGLVGRIKDAINAFLKDPVMFIINALLELLSIPPAAFWAVVAKIQKVVKDIADDPMNFANNLMKAVGQGFSQFFDHILTHLLHGFIDWLTGGLASAGVTLPKDTSLKSIVTFILQLMGITWPRIRKLLAKHIGEENVALLEKAYAIVANLIALGPEGVFEMIKQKLDPATILNQIVKAAVDYMITAVIKAVTARIILLFNPVGAILQALEAIYKVLKWIFVNAARIFRLIETIVNGIADIIAGNIGGMANAVEGALAMLIPPVIDFLADYLGFGDLPDKIKDTILGLQEWVEGVLDQVIGWLVEKGKALLKAIGLGGDEKDKDKKPGADKQIGKTVSFTAADHSHKLWIEAHGEGAAIMVASDQPMTVEDKLSSWESNLDKAGTRKGEAKSTIASARQKLTATETDVQAETQQKKKIKSQPEDTAASADFDKAEQKTEAEEDTLGSLLATLFEIFGEAKSVLVLLGEVLVKRGGDDNDDTRIDEVKGIKLPPDGYTMPDRDGTIHIQRKKAEGFPEVHLEPDGKLAEGPGKSRSATDEEKIAVYNGILKAVNKKKYKNIDDVDEYRSKMVKAVAAAFGDDLATLDAEVLNSTTLIPPAYNRVRGEIFERWLEVNMGAIGPGPVFASKSLGKDKVRIIADLTTADGASLVEAKALTVVRPPQAEEVEQMAAYGKVLGKVKGFTTATGVGKIYYRIVYVFNKPELPAKWKGALDDNLKGKYSTLP